MDNKLTLADIVRRVPHNKAEKFVYDKTPHIVEHDNARCNACALAAAVGELVKIAEGWTKWADENPGTHSSLTARACADELLARVGKGGAR